MTNGGHLRSVCTTAGAKQWNVGDRTIVSCFWYLWILSRIHSFDRLPLKTVFLLITIKIVAKSSAEWEKPVDEKRGELCTNLKIGWWMTLKEYSLPINFLICMDHPRSGGPLRRNGGYQLEADARLSLVTCHMSIVSMLGRSGPGYFFNLTRHVCIVTLMKRSAISRERNMIGHLFNCCHLSRVVDAWSDFERSPLEGPVIKKNFPCCGN